MLYKCSTCGEHHPLPMEDKRRVELLYHVVKRLYMLVREPTCRGYKNG